MALCKNSGLRGGHSHLDGNELVSLTGDKNCPGSTFPALGLATRSDVPAPKMRSLGAIFVLESDMSMAIHVNNVGRLIKIGETPHQEYWKDWEIHGHSHLRDSRPCICLFSPGLVQLFPGSYACRRMCRPNSSLPMVKRLLPGFAFR